MIKSFVILLIVMGYAGAAFSQNFQSLSFNDLDQLIKNHNGKTRVVNFWATWCKPCIEEMPAFIDAQRSANYKDIDFIFVSVDFQSQSEKVKDKISDLKMTGTIVQLNEKGTDWIDEMDKDWSGAIPYTIMIRPDGKKVSHYDWFENYGALKAFLDKNISN